MARGEYIPPAIKRRSIVIPMMLVSFCLLALIILYFLDFKQQGVGLFQSDIDKISVAFQESETQYAGLVDQIVSKRSPVADYTIEVTISSYHTLQNDLSTFSEDEINQTGTLRDTIQTRLTSLGLVREVNKTLQAEETVGTTLISYNICKKAINFKQSAAVITTKLTYCKKDLELTQKNVSLLPKESYKICLAKNTPVAVVAKMVKAHDYLEKYYALSSKSKAKDAAAADIIYRQTLKELQALPAWNSCITAYLQKQADAILNTK